MATVPPQDHDGQMVFLHLPKTAGTSLLALLHEQFAPDEICPATFHDELARLSADRIARYRLFRGHFFYDAVTKLPLHAPLWLTFLREPIDRVLSTYAHLQNYPDPQRHPWVSGQTVEAFLDHPLARAHVTNLQTRRLAATLRCETWTDLSRAVEAETQDVLGGKWPRAEDAIAVLDRMAFFGLTERYDDSLALLAHLFAWKPAPTAARLNVSPRRPQRAELSADLIDRIVQLNLEDIALYQHAQRLFEDRFRHMLHDVLDEHYWRHSLLFAHPKRQVRIDFSQPLPGASGWYPPEADAHGRAWRWSGPGTTSTLDCALAVEGDVQLRFCVLHAITPHIMASLRVCANARVIETHTRHTDDGMIVEGRVPVAALNHEQGRCRLSLEVERTVTPRSVQADNPDDRPLGIALSWLELAPATMESTAPPWRAQSVSHAALLPPAGTRAYTHDAGARELPLALEVTTRMTLLAERYANTFQPRTELALQVVERELENAPGDASRHELRVQHLIALDRPEQALQAVRRLTTLPHARVKHWLLRAQLERTVDASSAQMRAVVDALLNLAGDDLAIAGACRAMLAQTQAESTLISQRLVDFDFRVSRLRGVQVVVPPTRDVLAGEAVVGSDPAHDPLAYVDEQPAASVWLPAFAMARFPVTVAEYAAFVHAGHRPPVGWWLQQLFPDYPITYISWPDATAYATWLSALTGQCWRLATEAEWEKAARWDASHPQARIYPWGDQFERRACNCTAADTWPAMPIGLYPGGASPFDILDLAGGVWEWVSSLFHPYPYNADDGREQAVHPGERVLRGGAATSRPRLVRAACRGHRLPFDFAADVGFRLVRDLDRAGSPG